MLSINAKWLHIAPQRRRFPAEQELGCTNPFRRVAEFYQQSCERMRQIRGCRKIKSDAHQPPVTTCNNGCHASTTLSVQMIFNPQWPDTKVPGKQE